VHCLRAQHREYQRKDLMKLKRQVHRVLISITNEQATGSRKNNDKPGATRSGSDGIVVGGGTTNNVSKQESGGDDGDIDEEYDDEEYDRDAQEHDMQRNQDNHNSLNASLIERYRTLSQNRAQQDVAPAAGVTQQQQQQQPSSSTTTNPDGVPADSNLRETTVVESSTSGGQRMTIVDEGLSKKRSRDDPKSSSKRNKKLLSKRHSSASTSLGLDAYQKGESNRGDGATVSEAVPRPTERYSDLGGMEEVLKQIRQLVEYPLVRPELYRHLGVDPPRGVLLRGPPG
jgi:ATP-dependent 26S proteasome regulatory subunit